MDKLNHSIDQLDKELSKIPQAKQIDQYLGHPQAKTYVALSLSGLYLLLIVMNVFGSFLTNLLGFVYPAYASFKAIESKDKSDDTQWLVYWTVFASFTILETFTDIILYWLPFYFLLKSVLVLYLILPQFKGAASIYKNFLRPVLLQHTNSIDQAGSKLKKSLANAMKDEAAATEDEKME